MEEALDVAEAWILVRSDEWKKSENTKVSDSGDDGSWRRER